MPPETRKLWWSAPESDEEAEDSVMETLEALMALTLNYPLSLELTQYLATYVLAVELSKVQPEPHHLAGRRVQALGKTVHNVKRGRPFGRLLSNK